MLNRNKLTVQLKDKIIALDCALVPKPVCDRMTSMRNQQSLFDGDFPDFMLGHLYYLSDGGYSRLTFNYLDGHGLMLSSESTDQSKANWINCREMIADIERIGGQLGRLLERAEA